jgi:four helix bundle protein
MATKTYRDLLFWQRAFEVSKLCIVLVKDLPKETIAFIITNQLLRACASVGANISEGYGRFGTKEYARFLQMALGSANETEYWLLLLKDCYPKLVSRIDLIINKNCETIKMLTSSINKIRNKK